MAEGDIDRLHRAVLDDEDTARRFAEDPRAVAAEHGVTLTDDEHEKIKARTAGVEPAEVQNQVKTFGVKGMA